MEQYYRSIKVLKKPAWQWDYPNAAPCGTLTEQYVLQQLKEKSSLSIYYWSAENSRGEIDFLVQDEEKIIPIEVKAEENLQAKSLRVFVERNQGLKGMRLSMSPYREQDWLANYPLYSVSAIFG